jgi:hypothetical protein
MSAFCHDETDRMKLIFQKIIHAEAKFIYLYTLELRYAH